MTLTLVFLIGVALGFLCSVVTFALMWLIYTPGDDHPLTPEEIRKRAEKVYW